MLVRGEARRGGIVVLQCVRDELKGFPKSMLKRGIRVALGTDGAASNNSQDLFETAKLAALAAKVSTGDADAVTHLRF